MPPPFSFPLLPPLVLHPIRKGGGRKRRRGRKRDPMSTAGSWYTRKEKATKYCTCSGNQIFFLFELCFLYSHCFANPPPKKKKYDRSFFNKKMDSTPPTIVIFLSHEGVLFSSGDNNACQLGAWEKTHLQPISVARISKKKPFS